MVERRKELDQRYSRKKKMTKLKKKLAAATDSKDRETIVAKIKKLSPWWTEPKPV
jgi:indole-3-glycerol phosphate synthase